MQRHSFKALNSTFTVDSDYQFVKALGEGSSGCVVAAKHRRSGEGCAIKKITNINTKRILTKRCLREIKLLHHFRRHKNITCLYDMDIVFRSDGSFDEVYIYEELMEADLHSVIRSGQPLSDAHFQSFIYQTLCGLKYIHSADVLHRDLKPADLLVNADCELKICDFGLARGFNQAEKRGFMTEYVTARWYRAPEIMLSFANYGFAIDVWSVGCILAELLAGKPIFKGRDYVDQLNQILHIIGTPSEDTLRRVASPRAQDYIRSLPIRPRVPFAQLLPHANPLALDLLAKMLNFDPVKRITCDQALEHPYLAVWHDPIDEPVCPTKFDFFFAEEDSIEGMRKLIVEEVNLFRSEVRAKTQSDQSQREREKQRFDTVMLPVHLLRDAGQLKIYRHLFTFLAEKINSMNTLDPRLESLLPRLHTHFEKFVDYSTIVSISESRQFRATLLEASSMVRDNRFTVALDEDENQICALFREILLDSKDKSTIRTLRGEQAKCFMRVLQDALKRGSPLLQEDRLQRTAQRILIDLSKACGDVPSELYVKETIENVSSDPISWGGFGRIHRGLCNGRPVALKRLFSLRLENPALVQAFCKEAMIWKNLCGHPHILAFLGVDIESFPGEMCMVSEWMSNGTIIEFLEREPYHAVEKYLLQIAEGIQHLHSQGICHGDLKGANILVSGDREAKIADFGFANFDEMSYTTARMGTPKWMAPELLDNSQKFRRTKKSDIFAFACIAFEIYTGAPIFPDDSNPRACQRIMTGDRPERPADGGPMQNRIWDLIAWCWSQDPSSRPQIEDVVKKLREL